MLTSVEMKTNCEQWRWREKGGGEGKMASGGRGQDVLPTDTALYSPLILLYDTTNSYFSEQALCVMLVMSR